MEIEVETRQNTRDIATLTNNVTRLTVLVENGEKRHDEDRQTMRDIFSGLKSLNDKIGGVTNMQEKVNELASQMGGLRHDVKNLENGMQAIPLLKNKEVENEKKLVEHETRINTLESFKDKHDASTSTAKLFIHVLWAVFGSGITALGFYFLSDFFQHNPYHRTETKEIISGD